MSAAPGSGSFEVPATEPRDGGWEAFVEPMRIEMAGSSDVKPGCDSPEAAVAHFYASLMRGDDAWKQAVPGPDGDRDDVLRRKLETLLSWEFKAVELRQRRLRGTSRASVRVYLEVVTPEGPDEAEDDVEVRRQDDGRWLVTRPPT